MVTTGAEAARPGNLVTCAVRVSERGVPPAAGDASPLPFCPKAKAKGTRVVTAAGEEMQVRVGGVGAPPHSSPSLRA